MLPLGKNEKTIEATTKYIRKLIGVTGNISFDAACSLLLASKESLSGSFKNKSSSDTTSFCPKCMTPWIAGHFISRLISCPRNAKTIKTLVKMEKSKRLSGEKYLLLSAYKNNCNIHKVTCSICHNSVINKFKLPSNSKPLDNDSKILQKSEDIVTKLKKKKRKPKDKNAGLLVKPAYINVLDTANCSNDKVVCNIQNRDENSSSSDSDKEITHTPKNHTSIPKNKSGNRPNKKKHLPLNSFMSNIQSKSKKLSMSQIKINEKKKKKLKEILQNSSVDKKNNGDLASFLNTLL